MKKKKPKPVQTDQFQFGSVWFFILKIETQPTGFDSVRFGYFIVKTKNNIVFWGFSGLF